MLNVRWDEFVGFDFSQTDAFLKKCYRRIGADPLFIETAGGALRELAFFYDLPRPKAVEHFFVIHHLRGEKNMHILDITTQNDPVHSFQRFANMGELVEFVQEETGIGSGNFHFRYVPHHSFLEISGFSASKGPKKLLAIPEEMVRFHLLLETISEAGFDKKKRGLITMFQKAADLFELDKMYACTGLSSKEHVPPIRMMQGILKEELQEKRLQFNLCEAFLYKEFPREYFEASDPALLKDYQEHQLPYLSPGGISLETTGKIDIGEIIYAHVKYFQDRVPEEFEREN